MGKACLHSFHWLPVKSSLKLLCSPVYYVGWEDSKGWKVKVAQSCPTLCDSGLYSPYNCPGQNTRVGSLSLLQGIFPTQGLNPGLLHCRWILYQLSHGEAQHVHVCMLNHFSRVPLCARQTPLPGTLLARILEWVATPFSRGSSQPRHQTCLSYLSCIAGGFFTS